MAQHPQQIEWNREQNNLVVKLPLENGILNFTVDKRLINHLVANSPKVVIFYIELNNEKEKEFLVDFEGLEPLTTLENKLKVKVSEKKTEDELEKQLTVLGKYCIARGESHFARHISENGWQHQRKYFNLYAAEEVMFKTKLFEEKKKKDLDEKEAQAKRKAEEEAAKQAQKKSKLKECVNPACKQVIPNIPICPYCGTKQ